MIRKPIPCGTVTAAGKPTPSSCTMSLNPSGSTASVMVICCAWPLLYRIVDGFLHHAVQVRRYSLISNMQCQVTSDLARNVEQRLHIGRQLVQGRRQAMR